MGQLDIKILRARSLPNPTISETKIPRAFVRIIFYDSSTCDSNTNNNKTPKQQIFETSVVDSSNNPTWPQEVFKIQFGPSAATSVSSQQQQQQQSTSLASNIRLVLQVWHKDVFVKDELLGECEADLACLVRASVRSEVLQLTTKTSKTNAAGSSTSPVATAGDLSVKLLALDFGLEDPNNANHNAGLLMNSPSESFSASSNNQMHQHETVQQQRHSSVLQNLDEPQEYEKPTQNARALVTTSDDNHDDNEHHKAEEDESPQEEEIKEPESRPNMQQQGPTTPQQALFGGDGEPISIRKLVEEKLEARRRMKLQKQKQQQQQQIQKVAASPQSNNNNISHPTRKSNPDDPYFALIKKAMDKEEKSRTISKNKLHTKVAQQHGLMITDAATGPTTPNNNKNNDRQLVLASNTNNNNKTPTNQQRPSSKHSRFAVTSTPFQQQQKKRELQFDTSSSLSSSPQYELQQQPLHQNQSPFGKNKNSSSDDIAMHDPREIRSAIKACVDAEANRAFLSEVEAKALSRGKISYSISQRTTAFGNHAVGNGETLQEAFCYLCVSIAKSLIPGNDDDGDGDGANNNGKSGGVSHCTMIRKISSFLSNPVWVSKLSNGGGSGSSDSAASSSMISLLAHGSINLKKIQDNEEQEKNKKQQPKMMITDKNQQQQQQPQNDGDDEEKGKQVGEESVERNIENENFSRVQWALIHTAVDSPTLFIALHCPPAVETLYPCDAPQKGDKANEDGMFTPEQKDELNNYYLEKTRQEHKENESNGNDEDSNNNNSSKSKKKSTNSENNNNDFFAQRFVDHVFHNIGIGNRGDDEEDIREREDYEGEDNDNYDDQEDDDDEKKYEYAHEFVDEIFGRLLLNKNKMRNDENDEDENNDQNQDEEEINDLILYANNSNDHGIRQDNDDTGKKSNKKKFANQKHFNIFQTIRNKLKLPPTHEAVAVHLCLVIEEFLSSESHGRKIKRIVVCSHESVADLGGHVVMALRERMLQGGTSGNKTRKNNGNDDSNNILSSVSKRIIAITTNANLASTVPRRRNTNGNKNQNKPNTTSSSSASAGTETETNKQDEKAVVVVVAAAAEHQEVTAAPKEKKFSQQSPRDRALFLRAFFARLCVPIPKLSFDAEKRRGWRFVVMPDCFEWALSYFAPMALLNYQSRDFPRNRREARRESQQNQEKEDQASAAIKDDNDNNNNKDCKSSPKVSYSHPPTIDEVTSNLWQALSNVEGALDSVTGGCTLPGFILGATTLMNGLISKQVNDSIWDEVFVIVQEMYNNNNKQKTQQHSNYPPNYYQATSSSPNNNNQNTNSATTASSSSSSFPPLCQCFHGALPSDYFSARETSFVKRMKTYRHHYRSTGDNNSNAATPNKKSTSTKTTTIPVDAIRSYLLRNVSTRPFDAAIPPNADQAWIQAFFSQSFHEPHQILSRVNAKFMPPLSSILSATNGGSGSQMKNSNSSMPINRSSYNQDDNDNNGGGSVQRTNETYLREGAKNATLVRLRLEERIERAEYMKSRMQ